MVSVRQGDASLADLAEASQDGNSRRMDTAKDMIRSHINFLKKVSVAAGLSVIGAAAMAADADKGEQLAKRWCAACHLVEAGQKQASADVPPFASIASRPDFMPEKIAFFLLDPHPRMPNFPLSRTEAADIAAYIGSLRR